MQHPKTPAIIHPGTEQPADPFAGPGTLGDQRPPQVDPGHRAGPPQGSAAEEITLLERFEQTTDEIAASIAELHGYLTGRTRPAELRIITLTATSYEKTDQAARVAPSIGIFNATQAGAVRVGIAGERIASGGTFEVQNNQMLVLPFAVQDLELGVASGDSGALTATSRVFLWRYWTVQPAFRG